MRESNLSVSARFAFSAVPELFDSGFVFLQYVFHTQVVLLLNINLTVISLLQ